MSKEYIERDAVIDIIFRYSQVASEPPMDMEDAAILKELHQISNEIKNTPAADVEPVRHGRWLDEDSFDAHGSPIYRCSVCNRTVADNYISCHKFCLHCGAHMDGGNKNG